MGNPRRTHHSWRNLVSGLMAWSSYLSPHLFTANKGGWIWKKKKINPIIWICLFHWMKGSTDSQVTVSWTCYSRAEGTHGHAVPHITGRGPWFPCLHASSLRQSLVAVLQRLTSQIIWVKGEVALSRSTGSQLACIRCFPYFFYLKTS